MKPDPMSAHVTLRFDSETERDDFLLRVRPSTEVIRELDPLTITAGDATYTFLPAPGSDVYSLCQWERKWGKT